VVGAVLGLVGGRGGGGIKCVELCARQGAEGGCCLNENF